tara:strand:+ start:812 stop:1582 length:771 start_codon:yes stop_codon:yes gene_type:complete
MSYFKHFPKTIINGVEALDITRKASLNKLIKDSALSYMSYTVADGERPEDVAYYYYDDPQLVWIVLLSNDIIDPYSSWPKSNANLDGYIISQYEEKTGLKGDAVLLWAKDTSIAANIVYYQSQFDPEVTVNRASFVQLANSHTVTLDKATTATEYTITELGNVSQPDWNTFAGTTNKTYILGDTFVSAQSGASISSGSSASVKGSSATNPAREYYAVRVYDHEFNLNEEKREIQLINKGYVATIVNQLKTLLSDEK